MIVDASAIVSMLTKEDDAEPLLAKLAPAADRRTTVISAFEAVMAVSRKTAPDERAFELVSQFLGTLDIVVEPVGAELLADLTDAFHRYGRRSGHPAQLNMGDCFSYAMAKSLGVPLLYKGEDFAQTDLA